MKWLTRQFEIDEGGHHLGTRLWMRVSSNGLGGKSIKGTTERATPWPLFELAVSIEVGPTVLAARQKVSVRSIRRSLTVFVPGGEGRHRHSPRQTWALLGVWIYWEARDCCPHCHGWLRFDQASERDKQRLCNVCMYVCVRRPSETRTHPIGRHFRFLFSFPFPISPSFLEKQTGSPGWKTPHQLNH